MENYLYFFHCTVKTLIKNSEVSQQNCLGLQNVKFFGPHLAIKEVAGLSKENILSYKQSKNSKEWEFPS